MPNQHLIPFTFESHDVRTINISGNLWFVATDVCQALNIQNVTQAIERLDENERSMFNIGRQGEVNIINESGMYFLVMRCRGAIRQGTLPHRFRKWVTSEVLPSIRKTGRYERQSTQEYQIPHKSPSQAEKDAYYINTLLLHFSVVYEAWGKQIEPMLRMGISPIAENLYSRFLEISNIIPFIQESLNAKLLPGETPRIN